MKIKSLTFKEDKCVLLVDVETPFIPGHVKTFAENKLFISKQEFHITIIGNQEGKRLLSKISPEKIQILKQEIQKLDWSFQSLNKFYKIKKQSEKGFKESIIELVEMSSIDSNLSKLSDIIGDTIKKPFLHITLFIKNDREGFGIGVNTIDEFPLLNPKEIFEPQAKKIFIDKIYLPSRIQIDTIVGIFLIQRFGKDVFENIDNSQMEIVAVLNDGDSYSTLLEKKILAIDHAQGPFDHHGQPVKITSSRLVASYLDIDDDPAISKMLALAERCDFYGKGTISNDILDKTFGLSGIVTMLNQKYDSNPRKVYDIVFPILDSHYDEEKHRFFDLPQEIDRLCKNKEVQTFEVFQRGRRLKVISLPSEDATMSSYLRSGAGGSYDVVIQWLSSGHVNIITKQSSRVSLESLMVLIRKSELILEQQDSEVFDLNYFATPGRLKELPQWYYDEGTNTIQNGGINPGKNILPTKIPKGGMIEIVKMGLSESLWSPMQ